MTNSGSDARSGRLEGWKDIAEFLGVSERTARNWAKEHNLPVHRFTGSDRSRVWSTPDELTAWRAIMDTPQPVIEVESDTPPTGTTNRPSRLERRRWIWALATIVLVGGIGAIASVRVFATREPPAGIRVVQNTAVIVDAGGRELWRHVFSGKLQEIFPQYPWLYAFSDLGGDGRVSVLLSEDLEKTGVRPLYCFDQVGRTKWVFTPGHQVADRNSHRFDPPYAVTAVATVRGRNHKTASVIVTSVHNWSFADQVAVLDGVTGHVLSEYWHRGHVTHLLVADLDGDGEPEVLVGGVNDSPEYAKATVLIFDHRNVAGASRSFDGSPDFQGLVPGSEKAIVRFPKSPLSAGLEFNRVKQLEERGRLIHVAVSEATNEQGPCVVYDLDRSLTPVNVGLCDDFLDRYLAMRARNPALPAPQELTEQLKRKVEVWRRP